MNLCDIKTVRALMARHGLHFRKEFGQNFLTDPFVVSDIADSASPNPEATILEIGPGLGTLTRELAARYRSVVALEIDRSLIPVLGETLGEFSHVTVHNEDVMQADLSAILADAFAAGEVSVCANLPYYITSPILMRLLESGLPFGHITVMVQKEVADRLVSPPGGKDYGAITAAVAYYGEAHRLMEVPADRFVPAPKVDSAVVRIDLWREKPFCPRNEALLFQTIRAAFGQRRKTLANALATGFPELGKGAVARAIEACGLSPTVRGERLSVEEFVRLSDLLGDMKIEN